MICSASIHRHTIKTAITPSHANSLQVPARMEEFGHTHEPSLKVIPRVRAKLTLKFGLLKASRRHVDLWLQKLDDSFPDKLPQLHWHRVDDEAAGFIHIVASRNRNTGVEQPARQAARTAEQIHSRGCDDRAGTIFAAAFHCDKGCQRSAGGASRWWRLLAPLQGA